jgi:hypothetical protein
VLGEQAADQLMGRHQPDELAVGSEHREVGLPVVDHPPGRALLGFSRPDHRRVGLRQVLDERVLGGLEQPTQGHQTDQPALVEDDDLIDEVK